MVRVPLQPHLFLVHFGVSDSHGDPARAAPADPPFAPSHHECSLGLKPQGRVGSQVGRAVCGHCGVLVWGDNSPVPIPGRENQPAEPMGLTEKATEPLCHAERNSTATQKNGVQGFSFAVRCKVRPGVVFPPACST